MFGPLSIGTQRGAWSKIFEWSTLHDLQNRLQQTGSLYLFPVLRSQHPASQPNRVYKRILYLQKCAKNSQHDTSKQISTTIPLIWNSIEENSLTKNINFQFIFNQTEHGKPSDNKLHLPERRSTVSSLFKFKFIHRTREFPNMKRHFMNIYFSYFVTDFPGFFIWI
jgi:hypothetical protein